MKIMPITKHKFNKFNQQLTSADNKIKAVDKFVYPGNENRRRRLRNHKNCLSKFHL